MEFYVDIADLDRIKEVAEYFPIDGFTTNPTILTKSPRPLEEMMPAYRAFAREKHLNVFFQVTAQKAEDMFAQAKALRDYFGSCFIVKIPAVKEGYKATRMCKQAGIPVLVTVIHSTMQALMAAKAGADYVAPYINHIDNLGLDSARCVSEMLAAFAAGGYPCKVLGASFRSTEQIRKLAVIGCQAVTLRPEMFDALIAHPCTERDMENFRTNWEAAWGDRGVDAFVK